MNGKGLDFKHKEVINIKDGRRLRICARCYSRLRKWSNYLIMVAKKRIDVIGLNLRENIGIRTMLQKRNKKGQTMW